MLVAFSFRLLWNVNLPTRQRRMIRTIFSSSIIISLFSLFHAATSFVSLITSLTTVAVNLEVRSCSWSDVNPYIYIWQTSFSLIVCNLLVIVTCAYRALNRKPDEDPEDDDYSSRTQAVSTSQWLTTTNPSATSQQLTTVDLAISAETSASNIRVWISLGLEVHITYVYGTYFDLILIIIMIHHIGSNWWHITRLGRVIHLFYLNLLFFANVISTVGQRR
jgi:hypothetical protein